MTIPAPSTLAIPRHRDHDLGVRALPREVDMRLASLFCLPVVLVGISFAQSTNFSVGPQYLITSPEPQFLRPIETPSLALNAPLKPLPELSPVGPTVTNQSYVSNPELQHQADLFPIYYGYAPIVDVEL